MKTKVLQIVKNALCGAEDNLYRSTCQFGKMNELELEKEYGQSGRTCREIYQKYREDVDEIEECVKWVEAV